MVHIPKSFTHIYCFRENCNTVLYFTKLEGNHNTDFNLHMLDTMWCGYGFCMVMKRCYKLLVTCTISITRLCWSEHGSSHDCNIALLSAIFSAIFHILYFLFNFITQPSLIDHAICYIQEKRSQARWVPKATRTINTL